MRWLDTLYQPRGALAGLALLMDLLLALLCCVIAAGLYRLVIIAACKA